jgi:Flp pilus assembly protein protease CpaA
MEINPLYYKLAFVLVLLATITTGVDLTHVVLMGAGWFTVGAVFYYVGLCGGGDAKLLLPVGAYITYLGINSYAFILVMTFSAFVYLLAMGLWRIWSVRKLSGQIPFAPVYPISICLVVYLLKARGF